MNRNDFVNGMFWAPYRFFCLGIFGLIFETEVYQSILCPNNRTYKSTFFPFSLWLKLPMVGAFVQHVCPVNRYKPASKHSHNNYYKDNKFHTLMKFISFNTNSSQQFTTLFDLKYHPCLCIHM